mmetsp:Transcript_7882/g.15352  ORF Transcript_7882/g.15352 Transcript_7882/m.15352 type:complete len:315 (-) Transcript_7882:171-1115(-)
MVQVYKDPICRRYFSPILGFPFIARVVLHLGAIALSLVIAYATGGFWNKIRLQPIQATVHYTNDALIILEGSSVGQEQIWSTSQIVNEAMYSNFVPANFKVGEEDYNHDGKPDVINFKIKLSSSYPVHSVKSLFQFKYSVNSKFKLEMYGLAYVSHSSAVPGGYLYTDGQLLFQQTNPITDKWFNTRYNTPILNSTQPTNASAVQPQSQIQIASILQNYLDRNYTTLYANYYPVWHAGAVSTDFTLDIRIRIPSADVVKIRPQEIEMLKHGWIQFLATFAVIWWLLQYLEWFAFTYRLIPARVLLDTVPKQHRF